VEREDGAIGATEILLQIVGGVALLIWGVRTVRTGVERAFGAALRNAVAAGARNRFKAFAAGLGVTAVLQSSTATCLIVAAFAGGHLFATTPALAVMLGADVGSTLVAQVLSFDILWLSPVLITAGVVAFMACESGRLRQLGRAALGLGLMLLALRLIVGASAPLRDSPVLGEVLAPLATEPLVAAAVGVVLTWFLWTCIPTAASGRRLRISIAE
jgi:phosphate:Na+ symporter